MAPLSPLCGRLQHYFAGRRDVAAAILFGSTARGEARPDSDIDIGVLLTPEAAQQGIDRSRLIADIMGVLMTNNVDVVILNRASPLLMHRVVRDGRVIYSADDGALAEFTIRAIQQYEDTRPLRKLLRQRLRQRIASVSPRREGTSAPEAAVDRGFVEQRLTRLLESVNVLKQYQELTLEELTATPNVYWAVQHGLQICLQAVVDVAPHMVTALDGPLLESYRGHIAALGIVGVLPEPIADQLAALADLRDALLHDYMDIDPADVHRALTRKLGHLEAFADYVAKAMEGAPF